MRPIHTWNPVFRFTSFFSLVSEPEPISESSSALTRVDVFAFLVFFLGAAARREFPPRVGRAREFSSAWSLAANIASASTSSDLCFLAGGDALAGSEVTSLEAWRFTGDDEGGGDGTAAEAESPSRWP